MNEEMRLRIPARQSMMLVARMALSGLCAQLGADMDTLDDIRTASDEACYCLMHQGRAANTLTISCREEGPRMSICFEAERAPQRETDRANAQAHDPEVARGILETLVCKASLRYDEDGVYEIDLLVHLGAM